MEMDEIDIEDYLIEREGWIETDKVVGDKVVGKGRCKAIDNEELRKMIAENPDLPLVFEVYNDEICFDYGYSIFEGCRCWIGTVWFTDERMYDDKSDVVEEYVNMYEEAEGWCDLSNEEFYKRLEDLVEEEVRHYKAIIVRVG